MKNEMKNDKNINYQKELDALINGLKTRGETPRLLLHSCCAPCSTAVLEYLAGAFDITVFYYNPNIYPEAEYVKRLNEQKRLLPMLRSAGKINLIEGRYDSGAFYAAVKGLEEEAEGARRCFACYAFRLRETAKIAVKTGCDYFTTTLSVSPRKNAAVLNETGADLAREYQTRYLYSDFKKRDGYQRSVRLSGQYQLYRQNYCGCEYSFTARSRIQ